MSVETIFNQNVREDFKKSIGYAALVASPPAEKIVMLDWKKALAQVTDTKGIQWKGTIDEPALTSAGVGVVDARFESAQGMALVKITSLSGHWKERLDYVMWFESLSDMGSINRKLKPGVNDIFLIPQDSSHMASCSFLYGNFYLIISHWEQEDISALTQRLWEIMRDNSHPFPVGYKQPSIAISVNKNKISVGDTFSIQLKAMNAAANYQWLYELVENNLPKNVELLERDGNIFNVKALHKGTGKILFKAMNTNHFLIHDESIDIKVE